MTLRIRIAKLRRRWDPFYRAKWRRIRARQLALNLPYEMGEKWSPQVMGLEETLRYIIDHQCSVARYGDGEFALMCGRKMLFEDANGELGARLREILAAPPVTGLLCAVPGIFGNLGAYAERDHVFWREVLEWTRPTLYGALNEAYKGVPPRGVLGDSYISRPYLNLTDKAQAKRVFGLWRELVAGRNLLIVEGRYSRLGVGNDLFARAKSIRRIWCPPTGAFVKYGEIHSAVLREAKEGDLVLLALGATATILAADLAKEGLWAVDVGHFDVEYMWMKMGVSEKVAIPGRYVSEVLGGQEQIEVAGEEKRHNVVAKVL